MPSRKRLHRVARKGDMWSHFDKFSNLLDKRKPGKTHIPEDIAGLYYKMYRTKNGQRRRMLRRKIRKGGSGGHPDQGQNIHQPGQWH